MKAWTSYLAKSCQSCTAVHYNSSRGLQHSWESRNLTGSDIFSIPCYAARSMKDCVQVCQLSPVHLSPPFLRFTARHIQHEKPFLLNEFISLHYAPRSQVIGSAPYIDEWLQRSGCIFIIGLKCSYGPIMSLQQWPGPCYYSTHDSSSTKRLFRTPT